MKIEGYTFNLLKSATLTVIGEQIKRNICNRQKTNIIARTLQY